MFLQTKDGTFKKINESIWLEDKNSEDMSAVFFDANGDDCIDLYVVSGGNEFEANSPELQDRLYLNNGSGDFHKAKNSLPSMLISGSKAVPEDFDNDGDMDLFVGGRLIPGQYPWPTNSYLLENNKGIFKDVTKTLAPDFEKIGMVTDAVWTDFDNNGTKDLVLVGEWMSIQFFSNTSKGFLNVTENTGMDNTEGWWFSITSDDFDGDGDIDFVAGNLGLNYKYQATEQNPFEVFADDFDKNGKKDIVLSYYNFGTLFPLRGRSCSSQQIPSISKKFEDYNSFASANLVDVYGKEELDSAEIHYEAKTFATSYIENLGNGKFKIYKLSNEAQFSSVNKIIVKDFNRDGNKDILLGGNLFSSEVETPRNDASIGSYLKGDGNGNFYPVLNQQSGLFLTGDIKDIGEIRIGNSDFLIASKNNDELQFIKLE